MLSVKEKIVIEVIISFEKKAFEMIDMLASEFNLNLSENNPFSKIISRESNLWQGNLQNNWKYNFHGDACDFENIEDKQFVHVKINRGLNFGAIDNFYLFKYMQTTESLNYALKCLGKESVFYDTLSRLEEKKIIINIDTLPFKTILLKKQQIN